MMAEFTVKGVDRKSGNDVEVQIEADNFANARAKAELRGIAVTSAANPTASYIRRLVKVSLGVAAGISAAMFVLLLISGEAGEGGAGRALAGAAILLGLLSGLMHVKSAF